MADRSGYIGRAPSDSSVIVARQIFEPTGVQTNFTFSSGYSIGYLDAYLNGSRLIDGQDFTATNGSVVGLTSAAQIGDILELVAYKAFNVGDVTNANNNFRVGGNLTVNGNATLGVSNGIGTVTIGIGSTALLVQGNARVTGILSIGQGTITLDGSTNKITVGTGVTIDGASGIISAAQLYIGGTSVTGGGSQLSISTTAPVSPTNGQQWFDSSVGNTYVWYASQNVWVVSQTYGY